MEDKKGGKPMPKSDFPLKGIKAVNLLSQNENVLNPQNVHSQINIYKNKKQEQAGVKDVQTPSSPPQPPSSPCLRVEMTAPS